MSSSKFLNPDLLSPYKTKTVKPPKTLINKLGMPNKRQTLPQALIMAITTTRITILIPTVATIINTRSSKKDLLGYC